MVSAVAAMAPGEPSQPADVAEVSLFGRLPADPMGTGDLGEDGADLRRGRGRPPGSKNRSTSEWSRYILSRYRSPLLAMAEVAQAKPSELSLELGCDQTEAIKIILQAAATLAPYLHQKQPLAVQGNGLALMQVFIGDVGGPVAGGEVLFRPLEEIEQNQYVIDAVAERSESDDRNE